MIKTLCIIGLMIVLGVVFALFIPFIFSIGHLGNDFEDRYVYGLIFSVIILIIIISDITVNFYFNPEIYGYQKIVSENCVESEDEE